MAISDLKIEKMPVLPQVMSGILGLDIDNEVSFKDLDKLIKADQGVAATILKVANSPLYTRGHTIKTLQHAISTLGFKMIRSLVVLASSKSIFGGGKYEKFRKYVWRHSIVTAIIAKDLSLKVNLAKHQEEIFVAGLLHDIGKVILNSFERSQYIKTINLAIEKKLPMTDSEERVFGFNHLQAGEKAVIEWKLPEFFMRIVTGHNRITSAKFEKKEDQILTVVSYANYLAKKIGYGHYNSEDDGDSKILEPVLQLSNKEKEFYFNVMPDQLLKDEFYKFCAYLI
jgi:putative nucleotidyltransferase with HDIG domain